MTLRWTWTHAALAIVLGLSPAATSAQQKMYFISSSPEGIRRADLDGSNVEDLITNTLSKPDCIVLDPTGGKMYWSAHPTEHTYQIQRANLDGSNIEDLPITGSQHLGGMALDVAGGKIYWTERSDGRILRANMDGASAEVLLVDQDDPAAIALDMAAGKMYWTATGSIMRSDLDGANVEQILTNLASIHTWTLLLDHSAGKMYWANRLVIGRANIDGSNRQDLVTAEIGFGDTISRTSLALDVDAGKMYWIQGANLDSELKRANLDGSQVEVLAPVGPMKASRFLGLALHLPSGGPGRVYWVDGARHRIRRANLDGAAIEDVIPGLFNRPNRMALDPTGGKMYWTDDHPGRILRANLDGSSAEELPIAGLVRPAALALDLSNEKLYWADTVGGAYSNVGRANLDGSEAEIVHSYPTTPEALALDVPGGKMYWTDMANEIRSVDLDGAAFVAFTVGGAPLGVAIDPGMGKVYWTEFNVLASLHRANFDGSQDEELVTGMDLNEGLALDLTRGKVYWTNYDKEASSQIWRADLDGANPEALILNGDKGIRDIALDTRGVPAVPALSQWGLLATAVLALAAGAMVFLRRRRLNAEGR